MKSKPKGLSGWIKKNTKNKEEESLKYKDDPIKKR
jgi:hypothetical protein